MEVWALALFLAACGAVPVSADSANFIEGPVLLNRSNHSLTVVRCSIEVEGTAKPSIVFLIDGTPSNELPRLQCNSESVLHYEPEDRSVPRSCDGGNGKKRRHQALYIRTCPSDRSTYNPITIQCRVNSDEDDTLNTVNSTRMNLTYNQQLDPRIDPVDSDDAVVFLSQPVCPGEGQGVFTLQIQPTPTSPVSTASQPGPQSTATPMPSTLPTPITETPTVVDTDPLGRLSEGQLKLIIYVAAGVAGFFAILVICLVFVLCCVIMKKNRMRKAVPMRQRRRDVALGLGLTEDDKVVPVHSHDLGSELRDSRESTAHQLALHRGSARSSSHSSSIHSSNGDEEEGLMRTSVEVRTGPQMVVTAPSSFTNPDSSHSEAAPAAAEAEQEHDYDYIDEHRFPIRKEDGPPVPVRTRDRKKNTYVPEYETQPLHLCVSDTGSDTSDQFPTTSFQDSSMERSTLPPTSQYPGLGTGKQPDYVNRPAHDYVNRPPPHDYVNEEAPRGAVYHNSFMVGAQVHDYRNHQLPDRKVQTLVDMSALTDSYQELNTVDDSAASATADPCISGYDMGYTISSYAETLPMGLQRLETHRRAMQDMGTSTCGPEQVYHTLYPSDGDSTSGSTNDCSILQDGAAMSTAKVGGNSNYDRLAAATGGRGADVQLEKTSAPSSRRPSDYKDLEPTKMEGSSYYSTLKSTVTSSAGTQTYDTAN